jgi:hypothetical protein
MKAVFPPRYLPMQDTSMLGADATGTSQSLALAVPSVAPTPAPGMEWASRWLDASSNPKSLIPIEEQRSMKARILNQCMERKKLEDLERSRFGGSMRQLPPPLVGAGA